MSIKILYYVLIVLLIIFFIYLAISFVCYRIVFYNKEKYNPTLAADDPDANLGEFKEYITFTNELIKEFKEDKCEDVFIKSYDNKIMHARYFAYQEGAPIIICAHGYKAAVYRDNAAIINIAKKRGFNLLVIDERGQGQSDGRTMCFGAKEKKDILAWIEYCNVTYNTPKIILYGTSMGAASTLLALSMDDLPQNVRLAVVDAPYDKVDNSIVAIAKLSNLNAKPLLPFIHSGAVLFGHFKVKEADPIRYSSNIKTPVLIIHGGRDTMVPCEGSQKIAETNKEFITRKVYPSSNHVQSFVDKYDDYCATVNQFIDDHLNK